MPCFSNIALALLVSAASTSAGVIRSPKHKSPCTSLKWADVYSTEGGGRVTAGVPPVYTNFEYAKGSNVEIVNKSPDGLFYTGVATNKFAEGPTLGPYYYACIVETPSEGYAGFRSWCTEFAGSGDVEEGPITNAVMEVNDHCEVTSFVNYGRDLAGPLTTTVVTSITRHEAVAGRK
mmetsp:Transcript_45599/g.92051  ORF Transcript_45599/g.92051 Transcript_45599/m.92051 type:complete len:177 (+) Transcript_45599:120-650(+)|eukprot:CAMPEP_0171601852 /NCGR_PEP_ID=MMETSP0990-20121206/5131_1 /TAXON_ID=483369 /ORGANISM="non described non described, Strain CCMP2098" /LENGTH=176 /DNA_ID=CAMNT_0012164011 /DNA_START=106 /DNA_END=636 /DNA_ORIENTATION=-